MTEQVKQNNKITAVLGVTFVSLIEFDIKKGASLSEKYPTNFTIEPNFTEQFLADSCLPDGAHFHERQQTFLVLPVTENKILYGISFFRNKANASVERGAIQKSLLIVSTLPHFHLFESIAYTILEKIIDQPQKTSKYLQKLFTTFTNVEEHYSKYPQLNSSFYQVSLKLYDDIFNLPVPSFYQPNTFYRISLIQLIKLFGEKTILLWYYIMEGKRIMFVGNTSNDVGTNCLASCLLAQPLRNLERILIPYISLPNVDFLLEKKKFIAGCTNQIFASKKDWADLVCNTMVQGNPTFTQHNPDFQVRLSYSDKNFMKKIISQIAANPSEKWVRERFKKYTLTFLLGVKNNHMRKKHTKIFSKFFNNENYLEFVSVPGNVKKLDELQELKKLKISTKHPTALSALQKVRRVQSTTNTFFNSAVRGKSDQKEPHSRNGRSFDNGIPKTTEDISVPSEGWTQTIALRPRRKLTLDRPISGYYKLDPEFQSAMRSSIKRTNSSDYCLKDLCDDELKDAHSESPSNSDSMESSEAENNPANLVALDSSSDSIPDVLAKNERSAVIGSEKKLEMISTSRKFILLPLLGALLAVLLGVSLTFILA